MNSMHVLSCLWLRDTWDPFQLNPVGAEKEEKRRCFRVAQYLVAVIVGLAVITSAVVSKVYTCLSVHLSVCLSVMCDSSVSEVVPVKFPGTVPCKYLTLGHQGLETESGFTRIN